MRTTLTTLCGIIFQHEVEDRQHLMCYRDWPASGRVAETDRETASGRCIPSFESLTTHTAPELCAGMSYPVSSGFLSLFQHFLGCQGTIRPNSPFFPLSEMSSDPHLSLDLAIWRQLKREAKITSEGVIGHATSDPSLSHFPAGL